MNNMLRLLFLFTFSFYSAKGDGNIKVYNILNYGAKSGGQFDNTLVVQKCIDAAHANGGGMVLVPSGRFKIGVIQLTSNVNLHLAKNAVLLATANRLDYGKGKASALIVAKNASNVAITGAGTIDGQGDMLLKDIYRVIKNGTLKDSEWNVYNAWHQRRPEEDNRPKLILFTDCQQVAIKNITIKNGLCWIQDYRNCVGMVIDSIRVISNTFLNNDGIDLVDCKNVKLTNSFFNVADDGICLKSSDPNGACENIMIAHCKVRSSASAIKMGTASFGGFKHITIDDIEVFDTFRSAIAIESVDGAAINDIDVKNITAKNTGNAFFIRLGKRNEKSPIGSIKHVSIKNLVAEIAAGKPDAGYHMEGPRELFPHNVFPSSIAGVPGYAVEDVTLENIKINYKGTASKKVAFFNIDSLTKVPEKVADYPEFSMFGELPASGLYLRHVNQAAISNLQLTYSGSDFRNPIVGEDVRKIALKKIRVTNSSVLPVALFHTSEAINVDNLFSLKQTGAVKIR